MIEIEKIEKDIEGQVKSILDLGDKEVSLKPSFESFEDSLPWAKFIRLIDPYKLNLTFYPCRKISARDEADKEFSYAMAECKIACDWSKIR